MTPFTVLRYLVGDRESILRLARSRWTLAIGAALVLTASLARNYDGKYLPGEGEAMLHGIVVSVGNSFLLFSIFYLLAMAKRSGGVRPPFGRGYLSFLGLFWLTSPMAWFYAVPYERFLPPVDAISANLWTLAIVSVWRVGLMTRVLSVLWQTRPVPTLLLVAFYGDALVFAAASLMEAPLMDFMGGLQHSPEDAHLAGVQFSTVVLSTLAAPVLLIAALIGLKWLKPIWSLARAAKDERPSRGLVAITVAAVLVWIPLLLYAQPQQANRFRAESLLRSGNVKEALAFMAGRKRAEFPPIWDPPPRTGYGEHIPDARAIREGLLTLSPTDWPSPIYFRKHWRVALGDSYEWSMAPDRLAEHIDERGSPTDDQRSGLYFHIQHDPGLSSSDRVALRRALDKFKALDESAFFETPAK